MSTLSDLKQLLEQIMLESQDITDAEASSLALYDEAAQDFVFEIVLGEKGSETKQLRVKYGEGIRTFTCSIIHRSQDVDCCSELIRKQCNSFNKAHA